MKIKQEPISFSNHRGEKLWGFLHLPEAEDKLPAVITCHGFSKTKSQRKFVELSRNLAQNSIACLRFDFSGHGDSEGKFRNLSIDNQAEEIKSAYDFLIQQEKINKEKIAILGHSLGALAAVLFQAKHKLAKTLILLSPALHQKQLIKEWYTAEDIALWKKQGHLDTLKGRIGSGYLQESESMDLSKLASKLQVPTLLIHGEKDEDVSLKYTKDLLQKIKRECKLEVVQDADHHFESFRAKTKLSEVSLTWLKNHL